MKHTEYVRTGNALSKGKSLSKLSVAVLKDIVEYNRMEHEAVDEYSSEEEYTDKDHELIDISRRESSDMSTRATGRRAFNTFSLQSLDANGKGQGQSVVNIPITGDGHRPSKVGCFFQIEYTYTYALSYFSLFSLLSSLFSLLSSLSLSFDLIYFGCLIAQALLFSAHQLESLEEEDNKSEQNSEEVSISFPSSFYPLRSTCQFT